MADRLAMLFHEGLSQLLIFADAAGAVTSDAWVQSYDPLGSPWWSTLAAAMPVVILLGLLVLGVSAPKAALSGLSTALAVAIWVFGMPASAALAAAGYGAGFGLLPIGWIVVAAVFLFHLTVRSGSSMLSNDRSPRSRPTAACRRY